MELLRDKLDLIENFDDYSVTSEVNNFPNVVEEESSAQMYINSILGGIPGITAGSFFKKVSMDRWHIALPSESLFYPLNSRRVIRNFNGTVGVDIIADSIEKRNLRKLHDFISKEDLNYESSSDNISQHTIKLAEELLAFISLKYISPKNILRTNEGGILFTFRSYKMSLFIEIDSDGDIVMLINDLEEKKVKEAKETSSTKTAYEFIIQFFSTYGISSRARQK